MPRRVVLALCHWSDWYAVEKERCEEARGQGSSDRSLESYSWVEAASLTHRSRSLTFIFTAPKWFQFATSGYLVFMLITIE